MVCDMARLKSSQTQKLELARRKIKTRLDIVRGRVEADRHSGLMPDIERAEVHLHHLRLSDCEKTLDSIQDRLERREAERAAQVIANDIEGQAALMAERGVETVKAREGLTRDGWHWLIAKGRIRTDQQSTGNTLRRLHDQAMRDGLSSSANDNGKAANDDVDPFQRRVDASDKLRFVMGHLTDAAGHTGPADLLTSVCIKGQTLRSLAGDKDAAYAMEGQLRLALDMAGVALRLYRPPAPRGVAA